MTRVIGLISGTSVDGIDAALVEITGTDIDLKVELVAGATYPYPSELREQILEVCAGAALSMVELAELDDAIAFQFAKAAQAIQTDDTPTDLIGSHGQTVYHRPPVKQESRSFSEQGDREKGKLYTPLGYTLQLGRGEVIAQLTGIKTVSNFRVADIAAGGQAAPLVSKVDASLLSSPTRHRCIQNIGGIGNLTYLPARQGNWLEASVVGILDPVMLFWI
jgi:anhydro-N-acetylmuramic acid kinase